MKAKQSPTTGNLDSYPQEVIAAIDTCLAQTRELVDCEAVKRIKDISAHSRYFTDRDCVNRLAQDAVASSRPQRALQVLNIAHHFGCYLKPNHYEGVAYHLAGRSHWALIPLLVATAKHHCGRASVRLLNWNMRALVENKRYDQLDHAFEEFTNADLPPNRRTFHLLISGHVRNRNLKSAKQYLEKMAVAGFPVDPSTHAVIVAAYRSLGGDLKVQTRAFEGLRDLDGQLSTVVLNSIVQQLLDSRDEKAATRFMLAFDLPGGRGRDPTGSGNTTGLVGEHTPDTMSTRNPIDPPAVKPNAATFSILLRHMAREGKLSRMLKLLDHMKQAGIHPDPSILAALIRGYLAAGRSREAISIVAVLLNARSAAVAEVFCSMMQVQPLITLPVDVQGVPLTAHIFNALMSGLLDVMGLKATRNILRTMHAVGISPDNHTVEILMSFLERTQGTGPRQLIRVLRSFSSPTLRPTIRHIHIILRSILRREKFMTHGCGWNTTAAKYSKKRTFNPKYPEGRILGTTEHYHPTAGLKLPRRLRLKSWFGPILQSVSQQAIQSDRVTIALRLKYEALARSDMGTSQTVFRNMLAQGLHPTIHHYSTLMDGYAKMGDIRGAKQVLQDAFEAGFQPNAIMYTILVNGYGRRGKPEEAMRVFRAMIRAGIVPDVPSIDAVAHAYFAVGAYSVARRVLREMWAQVRPFPPELEHADLRTLAVTFRSYSLNPELGRRKLSVRQQRLLHWKMRAIKTEWMRFEQWAGSSPLSGGIDRHDGHPHKEE
jgi:pentatricopeptide repeat protein